MSQETEPQNVVVDWQKGTTKTITQIDSMIVRNNDTIIMSTNSKSQYTFQITNLKDTVYTILFKQITFDDKIELESELFDAEEANKVLKQLLTDAQKKIKGFEYSFLVDKNTALAYEVLNQKELEKFTEDLVKIVFDQLIKLSDKKPNQAESQELQLQIKEYVKEMMPAAMETMLNSFNYIFQAYSFPFILDETFTTEIEVSDVDQIQYGGIENKAQLIVNSSLKKDNLNLEYKYIYDKEIAFQNMVLAEGNENNITIDEFDLDERVISEFNIKTSWIKSSNSFINVRLGPITVRNVTYVTIK